MLRTPLTQGKSHRGGIPPPSPSHPQHHLSQRPAPTPPPPAATSFRCTTPSGRTGRDQQCADPIHAGRERGERGHGSVGTPPMPTGGHRWGVWSRPRCGWGLCQVGSTVVQAVAASSGWLRTGSAPLLHEQEQPPGMDTQQQPSLRGVDAHAYSSNMRCSAPRRLAAGCASCGVPHDRFPARPVTADAWQGQLTKAWF